MRNEPDIIKELREKEKKGFFSREKKSKDQTDCLDVSQCFEEMDIKDILMLKKISPLLKSFSKLIDIPSAIIDLDGNVLCAENWQRICTDFHRVNKKTSKRCIQSDTILANQLSSGKNFAIYTCHNGLTDAASPIMVNNCHVANIFVGQFLMEKPDIKRFQQQAKKYGFDEKKYLKALSEVPIIEKEKVPVILEYLVGLAQLIGELGVDALKQHHQRQHAEKSEMRYKQLFENANEAIFVAQDRHLKLMNPKTQDTLGYTLDELSTTPFLNFVHPKDRKMIISRHIKRMRGEKAPSNYSFRVIDKSGEVKWLEINVVAIEWEGRPATLNFLSDVTENIAAKKTLEESEERLRVLFDNTPDAIYLNTMNGTLIEGNKTAEKLVGYSRDEMVGKNFAELGILEKSELKKALVCLGKNKLGIATGPDEFCLVHKNGQRIDVEISTFPVKIKGEKIVMGIARDISARKKAETELKKTDTKLQKIFDSSPSAIITVDEFGKVTGWSPAATKIFGWSQKEVVGRLNPVIPLEMRNEFLSMIHDVQNNVELKSPRKDGSFVDVSFSTAPLIDDDGSFSGAISVLTDITDQKIVQQQIHEQNLQLKKMDLLKSNFLNVTSHELRTPMTAIKGYLQMLQGSRLDEEEIKHILEVVIRNTNRLDNLVEDILDTSRLESGTMKFIPKKIVVAEMIDEIVESMRASFDSHKIDAVVDLEHDLPALTVDVERIKQVFGNLLGNAMKFSEPDSSIFIRASLKNDMVLFEVEDEGRGIPNDQVDKVFDVFYQVDSGVDRKVGGTGLGLAISRGIILGHGGKIWVESVVGKGSTFKFMLPVRPVMDVEGTFRRVDLFKIKSYDSKLDFSDLDKKVNETIG